MNPIHQIWQWAVLHKTLIAVISGISLILCILTVIAIPLVIIALPENYFTRPRMFQNKNPSEASSMFIKRYSHPLIALLFLIIKNILGLFFVLTGFIMLFTPGQGLLTMFAGLLLMNFPGKRLLEQRVITVPSIRRTLEWIRLKAEKPPFIFP